MNIANYISNVVKIIQKKKGKKRVVISVAGAGCIGKTTFAEAFKKYIGDSICQVISLDGYMLEREKRNSLGYISGYDPRGFELSKARKDLSSLIDFNDPFILNRYNRQTHNRDIEELIEPKEVIFLEGGLALREELYNLADFHIFLYSEKDTQLSLRLRREQREFGYTVTQITDRFKRYYSDYLKYVHPQIKMADIILMIDTNYKITFIKNKPVARIQDINGIAFDLDGVLVNSKEANVYYYNEILSHFNEPKMNQEQEEMCHTLSSDQTMRLLFKNDKYRKAIEYKKLFTADNTIHLIKPEKSVYEILSKLQNEFILGIATNRQSSLRKVVDALELNDYFGRNIVSASETKKKKPHPDVILKLAERMKIEPSNMLYIGDSLLDYECSKNAGVFFCAYKFNVNNELSINSLDEIPLLISNDL